MQLKSLIFGVLLGALGTTSYFLLMAHTPLSRSQDLPDLLTKKADPLERVSKSGWSVLHVAAYKGNRVEVKLLAEAVQVQKKSIDPVDQHGFTPLMYAVAQGHDAVVQLLLENGASPNVQSHTGISPLILLSAQKKEQPTIAARLINAGARINHTDIEGYTALMAASFQNHENLVLLLHSKGANKNLKNKKGQTAYDIANSRGNRKIAQFLQN